jgi:hypothetical protein
MKEENDLLIQQTIPKLEFQIVRLQSEVSHQNFLNRIKTVWNSLEKDKTVMNYLIITAI